MKHHSAKQGVHSATHSSARHGNAWLRSVRTTNSSVPISLPIDRTNARQSNAGQQSSLSGFAGRRFAFYAMLSRCSTGLRSASIPLLRSVSTLRPLRVRRRAHHPCQLAELTRRSALLPVALPGENRARETRSRVSCTGATTPLCSERKESTALRDARVCSVLLVLVSNLRQSSPKWGLPGNVIAVAPALFRSPASLPCPILGARNAGINAQ